MTTSRRRFAWLFLAVLAGAIVCPAAALATMPCCADESHHAHGASSPEHRAPSSPSVCCADLYTFHAVVPSVRGETPAALLLVPAPATPSWSSISTLHGDAGLPAPSLLAHSNRVLRL
ncbi:MAG TPA: hypothetical protein VMW35_00965 [Myxococcota bacterium]|nr:hypothetical protein [Myxococcota bacterium]